MSIHSRLNSEEESGEKDEYQVQKNRANLLNPQAGGLGRTFVELVFDYNINKDEVNNYMVDLYFFVPQRLKINQATYSGESFFADLENYIRFKTPQIALIGIVNPNNSFSPLNRLKPPLTEILNGSSEQAHVDKVVYELKILGNIVRSQVRDQCHFLVKILGEKSRVAIAAKNLRKFLQELDDFFELFTKLEEMIYISQVPAEIQETYEIVGDYISWVVEKYLGQVYAALDPVKHELVSLRGLLEKRLEKEQEARKARQSKIILVPDDPKENQKFSYWLSLFKKYIASALYLQIGQKNERSRARQIFYGIAAGVAMFFSVWLGFLVQLYFPLDTLVFFLLVIFIYILKDRIKDLLRLSSERILIKYFPDRKFNIIDGSTGDKIGLCREFVRFVPQEQVPPEVQALRDAGSRGDLERRLKPENVLKYRKHIQLFPEKILKIHTRQKDVHDVVRYSIRNLLTFCDKPYTTSLVFDPAQRQLRPQFPAKVYHVNIVQQITFLSETEQASTQLKRSRIIFDRNGIRKVERVTETTASQEPD